MVPGLYARPLHWYLCLARAYGTGSSKHLHHVSHEELFLRDPSEYGQSVGYGNTQHPIGRESTEPSDCGLPQLYGTPSSDISEYDESSSKKKAYDEAVASSGLVDPLVELEIDIQSFDIPRLVSVYPDRSGIRWWTKAWFNNSESGEAAIEIDRQLAIKFINENIEKDEWLEQYFPKQMEIYHNAIEQTREQILSQLNL